MHNFNELSPQGKTTLQILQNKDLIADVLPPPLYIVDAFVLISELLNDHLPSDEGGTQSVDLNHEAKLKTIVARIEFLHQLFDAKKTYWQNSNFLDSPKKEKLFIESTRAAEDILEKFTTQFTPNLNKNQRLHLLNQYKQQFSIHADKNAQLVELLKISNTQLIAKSDTEASIYFFFIGLLSVFFIILTYQIAQTQTQAETEPEAKPILHLEQLTIPLVFGILAFLVFDLIIQFLGLENYSLGLRFLTLVFSGFIAVFSARMIVAKEIHLNRSMLQNEKRYREMILTILEEERKRVSRELHDGVIQLLGSAKFRFEQLTRNYIEGHPLPPTEIVRALELLKMSIDDIRRISHQMRPSLLDNLGLISAIEALIVDFEKRNETLVLYNFNIGQLKLSEQQNLALFRVAQEILTNIEKHSHATEVSFELSNENSNFLKFEVSDNGLGHDLETGNDKNIKSGLGLVHMQERILLLGGKIELNSSKGKGFKININIPIISGSNTENLVTN
jgi:signal transduction histidine kinase